MSEVILQAKNLSKSYGAFQAVKGITFSIQQGEIFSLLGPNGAGKTTTISMLSCLIEPSGGDAEIDGFSILKDGLQVRQRIGVVPQDIALYEALSALQNLEFWGRMYGMDGANLRTRIGEVLEQVALSDRAKDKVSSYSGGMKRRLNIAVGLLHRPKVVFMDEPTVGIDPQSRRKILDMITDLRDQGMTVLYTTHYMEEAAELSDRVGIVDHGELIALGTQKELTQMVGQQETLRLHFSEELLVEQFSTLFDNLPGVLAVTPLDHQLALAVQSAGEALAVVFAKAHEAGVRIRSVDIEEPNLEAVFLHLTGRALRD